ncbi:UDP-glucose/GDP-mannose dehydrogenase family protein [Hoeflea sp. TYP-13]|uniref:UDP-glucose/GDP-mannose dehydrogenase family protein n=1 Tax=Hoeflea sp. TYP-13 TaxID=3230023 RepID=UPI0034C5CEA2
MIITIIGTGYVGLVTGVCLSEFGFDVTCVDNVPEKIALLKNNVSPIYEPGLDQMIRSNAEAKRLHFTSDLEQCVPHSNVVFLAVGTPSAANGEDVDLTYVFSAVEDIAPHLQDGAVVIIKCTVVPGTCQRVKERIEELRPDLDFSVVSNPEFLREGSAIQDFMRPDRVVLGIHDERGREVAETLYRPLKLQDTPISVASLVGAEVSKYAANAFLAMKVSFINGIADLCEKVDGNIIEVSEIIGLDERIGDKFLRAGPGFGGSCFPKDTRALAAFARKVDAPQELVEATITLNETRKKHMAERVLATIGEPKGKTVAVLGVSFKPDTDDIRESPALAVLDLLIDSGVTVRAFDPKAMEAATELYPDVVWADDPYEAVVGAHAVVIMTEWNLLRALELDRLRDAMAEPLMIDLRNIHRRKEPTRYGFTYVSIGRDRAKPTSEVTA